MRRALCVWVALVACFSAVPALAEGTLGLPCKFKIDVRESCGDYGCVVAGTMDPDMIAPGTDGTCQLCNLDAECDGLKCDRKNGTCQEEIQPAIPPQPFRPSFHLAVADVTFDSEEGEPIIGAGYVYQVALREAHPQPRPGGGWITSDLPSWYGNLGISAAFAGERQNLFADAGFAYYSPGMPLLVTTLGASALYQRQGDGVWDLGDDEENTDRLGPAFTVGFLQNAYLRLSYGFPLRGPDSGAWLLSVIYMKDLVSDLVPDRFQKFIGR